MSAQAQQMQALVMQLHKVISGQTKADAENLKPEVKLTKPAAVSSSGSKVISIKKNLPRASGKAPVAETSKPLSSDVIPFDDDSDPRAKVGSTDGW